MMFLAGIVLSLSASGCFTFGDMVLLREGSLTMTMTYLDNRYLNKYKIFFRNIKKFIDMFFNYLCIDSYLNFM
jgi:hypothetical protein